MGEKRFIADGNMVRDIEGKIPIILTSDKKQLNEFLDGLNELHEETLILKRRMESKQKVIDAYEDYIKTLKEDGVLE